MRLVPPPALPLGSRQYQRLTPAGINQREADVALSFRRAIDRTIELRPELVLIAGDVFHTVRPSNPAILAVPDTPGMTRPKLEPDPAWKYNVLLLHGEIAGVLPKEATPLNRAAVEISREELGAARWDYVALGHYHVYREVEPNAYYSGSVDYTSANAWGELVEERQARVPGKGII